MMDQVEELSRKVLKLSFLRVTSEHQLTPLIKILLKRLESWIVIIIMLLLAKQHISTQVCFPTKSCNQN
jgi:hypothetical protein